MKVIFMAANCRWLCVGEGWGELDGECEVGSEGSERRRASLLYGGTTDWQK